MKGQYLAGEVAEPAAQGYYQLGAHHGLGVQARPFTTRPRATAVRRSIVYRFDWDPVKARANAAKHRVTFRLATSVFRDPLALTVYDDKHSEAEERWATLGQAGNGQYLVVIHTWKHQSPKEIAVRIVSARRATKEEMRNYQEQPR